MALDDDLAAPVIAGKLNSQQQANFDRMALKGAHEYIAELEAKGLYTQAQMDSAIATEREAIKQALRDVACKYARKAGEAGSDQKVGLLMRRSREAVEECLNVIRNQSGETQKA